MPLSSVECDSGGDNFEVEYTCDEFRPRFIRQNSRHVVPPKPLMTQRDTLTARNPINDKTAPTVAPIMASNPVIEPAMSISEGTHVIFTAIEEDQGRDPFVRATRSWNLVTPKQNATFPQFTSDSKPNNTTHLGGKPRIPKIVARKINGMLIGGAVGGVLGALLLVGSFWYCFQTRTKKRQSREERDTPGFFRKLRRKSGLSHSTSSSYGISDLESISSFGDDMLKDKPSNRSTPTSTSQMELEIRRRSSMDSASETSFASSPHVKTTDRHGAGKRDSAVGLCLQPPPMPNRKILTATSTPMKSRASENKMNPVYGYASDAPWSTSQAGCTQNQQVGSLRTYPRMGPYRGSFSGGPGRPGRSMHTSLSTVQEGSEHSQQLTPYLSDSSPKEEAYHDAPLAPEPVVLRPGRHEERPGRMPSDGEASSANSEPSSMYSLENSFELECCLEGIKPGGEHSKSRRAKEPVRATHMVGQAF